MQVLEEVLIQFGPIGFGEFKRHKEF
jgi:hypothetical protein